MIEWSLAASLTYDAALAIACTVAVKVGRTDERIGAAIIACASGVTDVAHPLALAARLPSRVVRLAINLVALAAFDALMVRSRKAWPVWMAGAQLAEVAMDLSVLLFPAEARPYGLLRGKFAYVGLAALLCGALRARRAACRDTRALPAGRGRTRSGQKSRQAPAHGHEAGAHHP